MSSKGQSVLSSFSSSMHTLFAIPNVTHTCMHACMQVEGSEAWNVEELSSFHHQVKSQSAVPSPPLSR